jgi:hypothetical protein
MRILFGAPRKSGNAQFRCLLATAYGLQPISPRDAPRGADSLGIAAWISGLPEKSVAGTSYECSPEVVAAKAHGVTLIGILRHPFDLFVSDFDVAQQRATRNKETAGDAAIWKQLSGHTLEDPDILEYASNGFSDEIAWLQSWQQGANAWVRYERLEADPAAVLADLTSLLGELSPSAISHAVAMCPAENLVVSRPERGRRMEALAAGAWRARLPEALWKLLYDRYEQEVRGLGYEVE